MCREALASVPSAVQSIDTITRRLLDERAMNDPMSKTMFGTCAWPCTRAGRAQSADARSQAAIAPRARRVYFGTHTKRNSDWMLCNAIRPYMLGWRKLELYEPLGVSGRCTTRCGRRGMCSVSSSTIQSGRQCVNSRRMPAIPIRTTRQC